MPNICHCADVIRKKRAACAALIVIAGYLLLHPDDQIRRRWWVRPWLEDRNQADLKLTSKEFKDDPEQFQQFLRMPEHIFNNLLQFIKSRIEKKNAVSVRDKLIVTLRFLATGETYQSLIYSFRIAESTISLFIPVVCRVIYEVLNNFYLKTPTTAAKWRDIAKDFENTWHIPNTIGALDGKYIVFRAPKTADSMYYNYKNSHNIVLLVLVDAHYKFTYIDVGVNGRVSDGDVFRQSTLSKAIANNNLNIPENKSFLGRNNPIPYAAFPLSEHILKPFLFRNMTAEQRIFNYRLSRGRKVVENAFGILANCFRIFLTTINLNPHKIQNITLACCALHNFLKIENPTSTQDDEVTDNEYLYV